MRCSRNDQRQGANSATHACKQESVEETPIADHNKLASNRVARQRSESSKEVGSACAATDLLDWGDDGAEDRRKPDHSAGADSK